VGLNGRVHLDKVGESVLRSCDLCPLARLDHVLRVHCAILFDVNTAHNRHLKAWSRLLICIFQRTTLVAFRFRSLLSVMYVTVAHRGEP
jgi:hypothetical protein